MATLGRYVQGYIHKKRETGLKLKAAVVKRIMAGKIEAFQAWKRSATSRIAKRETVLRCLVRLGKIQAGKAFGSWKAWAAKKTARARIARQCIQVSQTQIFN